MPKNVKFHRARSDEQIQQRRDGFLTAARALLEESGIEAVTLNSLASAVGLSKSNLYRYFESREDVLAEVYHKEAELLNADVIASFKSIPQRNDLSSCAALFSNACGGRPVFCLLHSQMVGRVEQHISLERLVVLKSDYAQMSMAAAQALFTAVPDLGELGARRGIQMFLHHLAGCWQFCNLGENAQAAIEKAEIDQFNQPFRLLMAQACHTILIGLVEQAKEA